MKILQLTTEFRLAGAERIVIELSYGLKLRGHNVLVVGLAPIPVDKACTILPELKQLDIPFKSCNLTKYSPWKLVTLKKIIEEFGPDVIHSHMIHANLLSRLFCPKEVKLINTVHTAEKRTNKGWHFILDKLSYSKKVNQTCVSIAVSKFHSKNLGVKDLPVIYNGIRRPKIFCDKRLLKLKKDWGLQDCDKILGSVGRLNQYKGFNWLLAELSSLEIPNEETWGFVIIGEGEERFKLEKLAEKLPENLIFRLPGFRDDAASCIAAFDCFVMPSDYEGFGLTLIEAMSYGVPIVANNVDSLPELMELYRNGVCVTRKQFLEAITKFIYLPKINTPFIFSNDKMVEEYLDIYHV